MIGGSLLKYLITTTQNTYLVIANNSTQAIRKVVAYCKNDNSVLAINENELCLSDYIELANKHMNNVPIQCIMQAELVVMFGCLEYSNIIIIK